MAAIFKIVFALLALIAIVSAVQAAGLDAKRAGTPPTQAAAHRGGIPGAKNSPKPVPGTLLHACKTVPYEKNGRTITAQKC